MCSKRRQLFGWKSKVSEVAGRERGSWKRPKNLKLEVALNGQNTGRDETVCLRQKNVDDN